MQKSTLPPYFLYGGDVFMTSVDLHARSRFFFGAILYLNE